MIRCIDVRKVYRQGKNEITALDGVSLDIARGEFAVIMGPSGSGKSTLLHLIGGLDRPTSGELLPGGVTWSRQAECVRRSVMQDPGVKARAGNGSANLGA